MMHVKKLVMSFGLVVSLSFLGCGGGSSQEAKELFQKLLTIMGIPYPLVVTVCQDDNRNGLCESTELQAKLFIEQGDTAESIWQKLTQIEEGKYFLETYDVTQPILLVLQDVDNVHYDEGKFTLNFNGFSSNEINETKELSILESMVDADAISVDQANKFRTLTNPEAQEKYYAELLLSLETNINTLRAKELDSQAAVAATIQEMADETIANQAQADKINACENNQTCVDEEIKTLSDELIITEEEADAILPKEQSTQENNLSTPIPESGEEVIYGQWVKPSQSVCENNGGRYYEFTNSADNGIPYEGTRYTECDADWENAQTICHASGGILPTIESLRAVVTDCGGVVNEYESNQNNTPYQACYREKGFSSYGYWSSTAYASDSTNAWGVGFYYGSDGWPSEVSKSPSGYVRCVRGGQ